MKIAAVEEKDKDWVREVALKEYGAKHCVFLGRKFFPENLPGFYAENERLQKVGLITYEINEDTCEIMTLNAFKAFQGIGNRLIKAVFQKAKEQHCKKIIVRTTNDNLDALRFYQRRGFQLVKIYPKSFDIDRKIKPAIPKIGCYQIPMNDAIELEYFLN